MANGESFDRAQAMFEMKELQAVIDFKQRVYDGKHPRFKPPTSATSSATTTAEHAQDIIDTTFVDPTRYTGVRDTGSVSLSSTTLRALPGIGSGQPGGGTSQTDPNHGYSAPSQSTAPKTPAINPVFLQKSDDLIRAEYALKRQALERVLKEQVERELEKGPPGIETLPEFDVGEVFAQALELVSRPSPPGRPSRVCQSPSDSFDDRTFYSSAHPSLEPSRSPNVPLAPGEVAQTTISQPHNQSPLFSGHVYSSNVIVAETKSDDDDDYTPPEVLDFSIASLQVSTQSSANVSPSVGLLSSSQQPPHTTADCQADVGIAKLQSHEQNIGASATGSAAGQNKVASSQQTVNSTNQELLGSAFPTAPPVFGHNLSPRAPQPARVTTLIANVSSNKPRQEISSRPSNHLLALREPSPDSSSLEKAEKLDNKKRKDRENKSSGKYSATDAFDSFNIKPEPRSPSPLGTACPSRPPPRKRQRQVYNQSQELNYDEFEPRYDVSVYGEAARTNGYNRPESIYTRAVEDGPYDPRQPASLEHSRTRPRQISDQYIPPLVTYREDHLRGGYPSYAANEPHQPMRATSIRILEQPPHDDQQSYIRREVIRSDANRLQSGSPGSHGVRSISTMMVPRRQVVVDQYGRELYSGLAPIQPQVVYLPSHSREQRVYDRALSRSAQEPVSEYINYRSPSEYPVGSQQRVSSQPSYVVDENIRPPMQFRSNSVHPEALPYDSEREYDPRAPSGLSRSMTVRPEDRMTMPLQVIRQNIRPSDVDLEQREFLPAPAPRQQSVRPGGLDLDQRDFMPPPPVRYLSVRPGGLDLDQRDFMPLPPVRYLSVRPEEAMAQQTYISAPQNRVQTAGPIEGNNIGFQQPGGPIFRRIVSDGGLAERRPNEVQVMTQQQMYRSENSRDGGMYR